MFENIPKRWNIFSLNDLATIITGNTPPKNHSEYYETEDIYITKNGKVIAKLSNPYQDRVDIAKSLFGILPADITLEDARKERTEQI